MNYWLVKQEPAKYSWEQFVKDDGTFWDGVRNFQARNNLKSMKKGDRVFFYHSVTGKEIRGVAEVAREAYPDPSGGDGGWVMVDLKPVSPLKKSVTLQDIKEHPDLQDIPLIKQSRLSVMPLDAKSFQLILKLGATSLAGK